MTKLTDKQEAFVANKAAGVANREAAIAAGYAQGSADVAAHRLMQKPAIKAAIKAATPRTTSAPGMPSVLRGKYKDSMALLMDAMNCERLPIGVRMDCAKALLPYQHARMGEKGKKETAKEKARNIARGRSKFATKAPPQLTVVRNE